MSQLKDMASEMQQIIKNLMSVVGSNREERDRLRQELVIAQEKISRLREIQRSCEGGELPLSPSSLQGGAPFAGLGGGGLLGASVEALQGLWMGDEKRSSLLSDDDGDESNASTTTTETTSEQALESVTGDKMEDRPSTPDQSSERLEAGNTSSGFTPSMGLQPGDNDKGNDKSDESDSDTCKAGGPGGVVMHGLTEQLDSFSSFTSESTLLACSVMTTDLDEGTASPEPPTRDDNEDDNKGDEDDDASKPSTTTTTTDCDLDAQEPGRAPTETDDPSASEEKGCSGAEAGDEGSQGEAGAEGTGQDRDVGSAHTTDLDSSDHTEPVEI